MTTQHNGNLFADLTFVVCPVAWRDEKQYEQISSLLKSGGATVVDTSKTPAILVIPDTDDDQERLAGKLAFGIGERFFDYLIHVHRVSVSWVTACVEQGQLSDYDDPFGAVKSLTDSRQLTRPANRASSLRLARYCEFMDSKQWRGREELYLALKHLDRENPQPPGQPGTARTFCQQHRAILERCSYSFGTGPSSSYLILPYQKSPKRTVEWWKTCRLQTVAFDFASLAPPPPPPPPPRPRQTPAPVPVRRPQSPPPGIHPLSAYHGSGRGPRSYYTFTGGLGGLRISSTPALRVSRIASKYSEPRGVSIFGLSRCSVKRVTRGDSPSLSDTASSTDSVRAYIEGCTTLSERAKRRKRQREKAGTTKSPAVDSRSKGIDTEGSKEGPGLGQTSGKTNATPGEDKGGDSDIWHRFRGHTSHWSRSVSTPAQVSLSHAVDHQKQSERGDKRRTSVESDSTPPPAKRNRVSDARGQTPPADQGPEVASIIPTSPLDWSNRKPGNTVAPRLATKPPQGAFASFAASEPLPFALAYDVDVPIGSGESEGGDSEAECTEEP